MNRREASIFAAWYAALALASTSPGHGPGLRVLGVLALVIAVWCFTYVMWPDP